MFYNFSHCPHSLEVQHNDIHNYCLLFHNAFTFQIKMFLLSSSSSSVDMALSQATTSIKVLPFWYFDLASPVHPHQDSVCSKPNCC